MKLPTHIGRIRIIATINNDAFIEELGVRLKLPRFNPSMDNTAISIDGKPYTLDRSQVIGIVNEK